MDSLVELLEDLLRHPLRTALTALSVAWGVFVLIVLLGASEGLSNQIAWQFRDDAVNSLWIRPDERYLPFEGQKVGARIQLNVDDLAAIAALDDVEHRAGRFHPGRLTVRYGDQTHNFGLRATHPEYRLIENTVLVSGRWLNDRDLDERRKVAVVGDEVVRILFRDAPHERVIGEWINVAGIAFRVVGVFSDNGGMHEQSQIYVPLTTGQAAYSGGRSIQVLTVTLTDPSAERAANLEDRVRRTLARRNHFDPEDEVAVRITNNFEAYDELCQVLDMLAVFTWIIGIGTVLGGMVGVGNIMLVSVEERRAEMGLRKALGATPRALIWMVVKQTIVLTSIAGYAGMITGIAVLEAFRRLGPDNDYVRDPAVSLYVALTAVLLLVVAGTLAGLVPAWRAASVDPITALRDG